VGLDADRVSADFAESFPEIAWPEKPPPRAPLPEAAPAGPLRILLDDHAEERWLRVAERATVMVLRTVAAAAAVLVVTLALGVDDHWKALCLTGAFYHALTLIVYERSPRAWVRRVRCRLRTPRDAADGPTSIEAPLGEPLEAAGR
jgi:hypothetical protein